MTRRRLRAIAAAAVLFLAGCGGGPTEERPSRQTKAPASPRLPAAPPHVDAYSPGPGEEFPNAKRLAGRVAQEALTYSRGTSALTVARRFDSADPNARELAARLSPAVHRDRRSWADVRYVQLSGVTASSFGAMVVVRQRSEDDRGRRHVATRVVDVRLRRTGGPWRLATIGGIGGSPRGRPAGLPSEARRVLDHRNISLTDSARWDVYRGRVDKALLRTLARAADRWRISISVLSSGHPSRVWATRRVSSHTRGAAADIYAVAGTPVIRQRDVGSPAYRLAASFVAGNAAQVGAPWTLSPGGRRSFSDDVHQDHIHVQQTARPGDEGERGRS